VNGEIRLSITGRLPHKPSLLPAITAPSAIDYAIKKFPLDLPGGVSSTTSVISAQAITKLKAKTDDAFSDLGSILVARDLQGRGNATLAPFRGLETQIIFHPSKDAAQIFVWNIFGVGGPKVERGAVEALPDVSNTGGKLINRLN
jgi:hypothetical protein